METSNLRISLDVARLREHRKTLITPNLQSLYSDHFFESDVSLGGIVHTLCGEPVQHEGWRFEGLHHLPSAQKFWSSMPKSNMPTLHVELEARWPVFRHQPYATLARVRTPEATGRPGGEIKTMFPREYTAEDVLRSIVTAYKTRSKKRDDRTKNKKGEDVFVTDGQALHRGSKIPMPIFMVLDARNKKIITARPMVGKRSLNLNLT